MWVVRPDTVTAQVTQPAGQGGNSTLGQPTGSSLRPQRRQDPDGELLGAVGRDLVQPVVDPSVGKATGESGAIVRDLDVRQRELARRLRPPQLEKRPCGVVRHGLGNGCRTTERADVRQQGVPAVQQPELAMFERRDVVGEPDADVLPVPVQAGQLVRPAPTR